MALYPGILVILLKKCSIGNLSFEYQICSFSLKAGSEKFVVTVQSLYIKKHLVWFSCIHPVVVCTEAKVDVSLLTFFVILHYYLCKGSV